jgi:hypothetical protein
MQTEVATDDALEIRGVLAARPIRPLPIPVQVPKQVRRPVFWIDTNGPNDEKSNTEACEGCLQHDLNRRPAQRQPKRIEDQRTNHPHPRVERHRERTRREEAGLPPLFY